LDGITKWAQERHFQLQGEHRVEPVIETAQDLLYLSGNAIVIAIYSSATWLGIQLDKIEVVFQGDIDHRDFSTTIKVSGDAEEAILENMALESYELFPVFDTPKIIIEK
jgi:hypothetical protein